ncbi:MAG: hypothetical protein ABII07_04585 [Patescibacteria group bacterium]|nr:hypothetical protein [Patescibacteria group bacterium]
MSETSRNNDSVLPEGTLFPPDSAFDFDAEPEPLRPGLRDRLVRMHDVAAAKSIMKSGGIIEDSVRQGRILSAMIINDDLNSRRSMDFSGERPFFQLDAGKAASFGLIDRESCERVCRGALHRLQLEFAVPLSTRSHVSTGFSGAALFTNPDGSATVDSYDEFHRCFVFTLGDDGSISVSGKIVKSHKTQGVLIVSGEEIVL